MQKLQLKEIQVHPGGNIGTSGDYTLPLSGAWLLCVCGHIQSSQRLAEQNFADCHVSVARRE